MTNDITPPSDVWDLADFNDAFRRAGPNGDWVVTRSVHDLGAAFVSEATRAVMRFADFTADNDPYGAHDFGALTVAGQKIFFKIDCYDLSLDMGSPDPTDEFVTRRVMTIMLPQDY